LNDTGQKAVLLLEVLLSAKMSTTIPEFALKRQQENEENSVNISSP
jgi:hypothetical protein